MNYYESIYNNTKDWIKQTTKESFIPPELLFALCCNESGLWLAKNKEVPMRTEPHVLNALRLVQKGHKVDYKGITMDDILDKPQDELIRLSSSYGITQIMGWWTLKYIPFKIDLISSNPLEALKATEYILTLSQDKQPPGNESAFKYIIDMDYESVLRIWNTGKHNGKTYHEDYVNNGFKSAILWLKYEEISKK